jgi:hypothetical protein
MAAADRETAEGLDIYRDAARVWSIWTAGDDSGGVARIRELQHHRGNGHGGTRVPRSARRYPHHARQQEKEEIQGRRQLTARARM